jgi:threonine synthase
MQAVTPTLNGNIKRFACSLTGKTVPFDGTRPLGMCTCCPAPGMPLVVEYDYTDISMQPALPPFVASTDPGIWRYSPLLPVHGVSDSFAIDVGQTPEVRHERLGDELGVDLYFKLEGSNPSGSFKDRGLSMAVALGLALGAERFCLPTQGNAGVAAALFSARAGLEGPMIYMPESHEGSLYHRMAASFGASVRFAGPNIAEAGKRMRAHLAEPLASGQYVDVSTFFEPGRLEGKKTMGLEIAETFGAGELPHAILYPTGGGTGLVGIWKAFRELRALGVLREEHRAPRLYAVQSKNCCPVVRAFEAKKQRVEPVVSKGTCADGLDVPGAIMGHEILKVLSESEGGAIAVSEASIESAFERLGRAGVSSSFEGAAAFEGARQLCKSGVIKPGERVVVLVTAGRLVGVGSTLGR